MTSLAEHARESTGGGAVGQGVAEAALENPFRHQKRYRCANCGGEPTFQPVDRFPCGWRGYCLGCGEVKYVMDDRTSSS
jgi:hypothetical protein